jgi:hypothetical protein
MIFIVEAVDFGIGYVLLCRDKIKKWRAAELYPNFGWVLKDSRRLQRNIQSVGTNARQRVNCGVNGKLHAWLYIC